MVHRGTGLKGQASRTWSHHPVNPKSWRPQKCAKSQENQLPRKGVRNHSLFHPDAVENELRLQKGHHKWGGGFLMIRIPSNLHPYNQNPQSTAVWLHLTPGTVINTYNVQIPVSVKDTCWQADKIKCISFGCEWRGEGNFCEPTEASFPKQGGGEVVGWREGKLGKIVYTLTD